MKARNTCAIILLFFLLLGSINAKTSSLFSPEDKPTTTLIELLNNAKTSIHAAVYCFTDKAIADTIINIRKTKKFDIKIILDPMSTDKKYGKGTYLANNNIDVFVFNPTQKTFGEDKVFSNKPIMHNKFVVIDGVLVWTGSFNWTVSANTRNCENVIYTDTREICQRYEGYFSHLLNRCTKYDPMIIDIDHATIHHDVKQVSLRQDVLDAVHTTKDDASLAEKLVTILQKHALVGFQAE
jgi:phosphatidylserine/phosphatidylglycerophosphate/cardiolipin synthase-like enzyme